MKPTSVNSESVLLGVLCGSPNKIFDIDGNVIRSSDFSSDVTRCIYDAIKDIAEKSKTSKIVVDAVLLEERVASIFPTVYNAKKNEINKAIQAIIAKKNRDIDIREHARIILTASIKTQSMACVERLQSFVEEENDPKKLISGMEQKVCEFTGNLFGNGDIGPIAEGYSEWLQKRVGEAALGKIHLGIKSGMSIYDGCIGGGFRRGTINVIAARAKMGKSFLGLNIAYNVARTGTPVLYMDTELDRPTQNTRLVSIITGIPLQTIETASFRNDPEQVMMIKNALVEIEQLPIHYVDIKGWGITEQLSVIRRFYIKMVGKIDGKYKDGLVILDYLKLMDVNDKGFDQKEWETLGYRMTAFHDLMGEVENPMFMLVQQNRDGLNKQDESTVSGSDRIIWFCDNFSIFVKKTDIELQASQDKTTEDPLYRMTTCKLIITNSRHGPGTKGGRYIAIDADIHNPGKNETQVSGRITEVRMELPYNPHA